jgi:hypothetical protein
VEAAQTSPSSSSSSSAPPASDKRYLVEFLRGPAIDTFTFRRLFNELRVKLEGGLPAQLV